MEEKRRWVFSSERPDAPSAVHEASCLKLATKFNPEGFSLLCYTVMVRIMEASILVSKANNSFLEFAFRFIIRVTSPIVILRRPVGRGLYTIGKGYRLYL